MMMNQQFDPQMISAHMNPMMNQQFDPQMMSATNESYDESTI
jgi:hypothetical protein